MLHFVRLIIFEKENWHLNLNDRNKQIKKHNFDSIL